MKKILPILVLLGLFCSCQKDEVLSEPNGQVISFSDARQLSSVVFLDDSISKTTKIICSNATLTYEWQTAYQSPIFLKTRLLSSKLTDGSEIILVGLSDISYGKLLVVKNKELIATKDCSIVKIIKAKLVDNVLWIKYNNTWARTATLDDQTSFFALN